VAIEAELTALLRDPDQVRAELAARAGPPETSVYTDTYYDRPDSSMDAAGYELRVRTVITGESIRILLTYKQPAVSEWGAKPEHETVIADAKVLDTIFTGLGLIELIAFRKDCDNYRFTAYGRELLATVARIPELHGQTFLELETLAEPDDLDAAHAVLRTVLTELGVRLADLSTISYTDRVKRQRDRGSR
jgi:adenylate cyclase class 2